jgi:DNA-binding transcriptional LysR family regulator
LRATQEPSPALIARPLCRVPFYLAGTPAYLARRGGVPALPADLAKLGAIVPSYVNLENLALKGPGGRMFPLRLAPAMRSDDTTLTLHTVHADMGIAFMPLWLIDDDIAQGRLVRLLPEFESMPVTLFAVYTSRQYMSPKLRTFIDFLSERLGAQAPAKAPQNAPFRGKVMQARLKS